MPGLFHFPGEQGLIGSMVRFFVRIFDGRGSAEDIALFHRGIPDGRGFVGDFARSFLLKLPSYVKRKQ